MSDWDVFFQDQIDHVNIHLQFPYLPLLVVQQRVPDLSCNICFPDQHPPEDTWLLFRQWFAETYRVRHHSDNTRRYWVLIQTSQRPLTDPWYLEAFRRLAYTVYYNNLPPPSDHLAQVVLNAYQLYQRFTVDPNELENHYLDNRTARNIDSNSEASDSSSDAELPPLPDSDTGSEGSDSEPEDQNQQQQPRALPAPGPPSPMAALPPVNQGLPPNLAQGILDALNRVGDQRALLNVKQFNGYDQDPDGWLREYMKAANARGWDEPTMLEAVPSYLSDAAFTWLENLDGQIRRWRPTQQHPNRARAFTSAFVDEFRTPQQERQWQMELDKRIQRKDETVKQYATAFAAMVKRVYPTGGIPEGTKIHMFLRGLLPAIQFQLQNYLICNDRLTYQGVVTAAQHYEQSHVAHLQALADTAPSATVGLAATATTAPVFDQTDPMKDLMQQMTQLLQPMTTAISQLQQQMAQVQQRPQPAPRQQYQPVPTANPAAPTYRPRQPRTTFTCHRCGQYGHIARICPNQLAPQAPVQPTTAAQPPPALYATAPQTAGQPTMTPPLQAPQVQTLDPQSFQPAPQARNVRFASPAQIPRPDTAHFCIDDDSEAEYLNF